MISPILVVLLKIWLTTMLKMDHFVQQNNEIGDIVIWRQGGESIYSYVQFMRRILCDQTKTLELHLEGNGGF